MKLLPYRGYDNGDESLTDIKSYKQKVILRLELMYCINLSDRIDLAAKIKYYLN